MLLSNILLLAGLFLLIRGIPQQRIRKYFLLALSIIFVFSLQPTLSIRNFDFWLPLTTTGLTLVCWAFCCRNDTSRLSDNRSELLNIFGTVLFIALSRVFSFEGIFTASRPPILSVSLPWIAGWFILFFIFYYFGGSKPKKLFSLFIGFILLILILLKTPRLALQVSRFFRNLAGQSAELATANDLRWFGFSYIAFRLLSVLIDARKGRKWVATPGDFLIYVCFPPALAAGPIDRLDHFDKELNSVPHPFPEDFREGIPRIATGLFKKFILADSLALVALSSQNAVLIKHTGWAWASLFAYSLQLYFDFSGYSDVAIGLAHLIGIKLPENFNHPYLKPDIAKFWNSWHITLTQWIRSYTFNPLVRKLRKKKDPAFPQWFMILITQSVTMGLIGLWHGVTLNFFIWGIWNALGLFFHQLYADHTKNQLTVISEEHSIAFRIYTIGSTLLTFLFVSLGWIWFVLPNIDSAALFFERLF